VPRTAYPCASNSATQCPAMNPDAPVTRTNGMVWAIAHGLASLWVDGPLETLSTGFADSPEDLTRQVADGLGAILTGAARAGVRFDP
jgi:hypothetical protein